MRTVRLATRLCLTAAFCLGAACPSAASARGRLFDEQVSPAFDKLVKNAHDELEIERGLERDASRGDRSREKPDSVGATGAGPRSGRTYSKNRSRAALQRLADDDPGDEDDDDAAAAPRRLSLDEEPSSRSPRRPDEAGERENRKFRLPHSNLEARGTPAVGFFNRFAALSIAWATTPLHFTRQEWKTAGVFVAVPVALIVSGFDDSNLRLLSQNRSSFKDSLTKNGDELGRVPVAASILAGFGAYGYVFDDERAIHTAESGVISTMLAGGLTTALKYAVGRTRPTAGLGSKQFAPFGGEMSFPSGHTTVAFSLAGVINYHYPGWLGRTALFGACLTGYARVYDLHHWTSDVVFAAMISSATAHYVSRMNLAAAHGDLTFTPMLEGDARGMAVSRRF